jgi:hypothetical protein
MIDEQKKTHETEDEEFYFKINFQTLSRPQFLTKSVETTLDESIKTIRVEKFCVKRMVWQ